MEELFRNLGIKWQLLLAQVVNFFILLFILKKFLYRPMLKFLKERRNAIEDGLKKSELAQKQFQEFREMQARELAKTREEAQRIIEESKRRADEAKNQILLEAKDQAEALFARTQKEIESLKKQKLLEAERQLGKMAVLGMEYLIKEKVSEDKKMQLANDAINYIKSSQ